MAKKLQLLKAKRKQQFDSLLRIESFVNEASNQDKKPSEFEIRCRFERLPSIFELFETIQSEIEIITDFEEEEGQFRIEFENHYFRLHAELQELIVKFKNGAFDSDPSQNKSMSVSAPQQANFQLPLMNLPTFDGEYQRWLEFRDSFLTIVDNNSSLSNIQKFYHLRSCLSKQVLETIKAIPVTNDNYQLAWKQLTNKYERNHLIAKNHVASILSFPKVMKESSAELTNLYNCLHNNLEALRTLNVAIEHWDLILIPIVTTKLDPVTLKEWEKFSVAKKEVTFDELLTLINNRTEFLERIEVSKNSFRQPNSQIMNKVSTGIHFQNKVHACKICNGDHPIFKCDSFLKLTTPERIKRVREKGLCLNCLKSSHLTNQCLSSHCRKCGKPHNSLLHIDSNKKRPEEATSPKNSDTVTVAATHIQAKNNSDSQSQVILPTAVVFVADANHKWHRCRALLDSGAMSNLISQKMCTKLRLPMERINYSIKGIGESIQNVQHRVKINFHSTTGSKETFEATCLVIEKVTSNLPFISLDKNILKLPQSLALADIHFNVSGPIDLLLGSSIFWELLGNGRLRIAETKLILQETRLGWIVGGQFAKTNNKFLLNQNQIVCVNTIHNSLEDKIKKFWEIEEVEVPCSMNPEDAYCEEHFKRTHRRDSSGRFVVKIPFRSNLNELGNSRNLALKRFYKLEQRLLGNKELYAEYKKIMNEYKSMKHMKEVTEEPLESQNFYIPHHAVVRQESKTTKTRVVYNASMKSTSGLSLNEVQFVGPSIQNEIFVILMNFRLHKYIISSDISKMYRMIWLSDEHKPFHRIFWRDNPTENVKCFELQTVTFGTASAPFLALRCLRQLAIENENTHPKAAKAIKDNFYVDDFVYGADSVSDLVKLQHEISTILASAGFYLRKWLTNHSEIYDKIHLNPGLECNTLQFGDKTNKTLGISWDSVNDEILYCNASLNRIYPPTKRAVLSGLAKIFDPLGLLGPVFVVGKLLMQQLWKLQISWDEPLPSSLAEQWQFFQIDVQNIGTIKIPRRVLIDDFIADKTEIHGFCDASERAYGACLFIKSYNRENKIHTKLLCSKSRVAPLKTICIPRLELCAALLLAKLMKKVLTSIDVKITQVNYWTDSTIVLAWIKGEPGRWKTFVANRVSKIQQLTSVENWHHVSSQDNPADVLSRGTSVNQLQNYSIWWSGPDWLINNKLPVDKFSLNISKIPEERVEIHLNTTDKFDIFERYSSYRKLSRVVAYCLRFWKNCKNPSEKRIKGDLSVEEIRHSETALLRKMQEESFTEEYNSLKRSKNLNNKSRLLSLNPFLDQNQLIRVGGRLKKGEISFDSKHPIILSPKHPLTKLLIKMIHCDNFHCGPTSLLSFVRQKFWPIDGRNLVKGIVRGCRVCFIARPRACKYLMGQLPKIRITQSFPFENVGIDYAGPLLIKDRTTRNPKILKAYVCLFICMATKAIHLECVSDLSTERFLACLRRFIGRRGKPNNIYSDNGSNFKGACEEMKRFYKLISENSNEINKFFVDKQITWHFIPARSPTFGGIWEAGIKNVKSLLIKTMKNTKFNFEDLCTILCQIEAVLNSRPLTPMSSDPSDLTPLTPGHFLLGRSLNHCPEISNPHSIPASRLKQYQHYQEQINHFWKRWKNEYISELQIRNKWKTDHSNSKNPIEIGKMVLIKDETLPPLQWPLGRIVELHPGEDNIARVVSVQLRGKIVKRGLSKICLLPEDL